MASVLSLNELEQGLPGRRKIVLSSNVNEGLLRVAQVGKRSLVDKRSLHKDLKPRVKTKQAGGVLEQLLCGAFAGVVSRTAVAPLDLIRTHLLTSHGVPNAQRTAFGVFSSILKRDGWRGLFRSNGINCLRVGPNKAIELCVFESLRRSLSKENHPLKNVASTIAGGAAGIAGTLATYPLELIRTRISIQPNLYHGLVQSCGKIIREEGVGALYNGLAPSLFGIFPYAAANYFVYDSLRGLYRKTTGRENVPTIPTLFFGAIAGATSSTVTFPIEVARRQLQLGAANGYLGKHSAVSVIANIYKQEGLLALYRGMGITWLKLVPAAGISFVCYEAARVALGVDDASFARAAKATLPAKISNAMLNNDDDLPIADDDSSESTL